MAEFDKLYFLQLLRDAPERKPLIDEPQYCEYLKTEVFGQLEKNGVLDLLELDLSNVSLRDLAPQGYPDIYEETAGGWVQGINSRLKRTPAAHLKQRAFF